MAVKEIFSTFFHCPVPYKRERKTIGNNLEKRCLTGSFRLIEIISTAAPKRLLVVRHTRWQTRICYTGRPMIRHPRAYTEIKPTLDPEYITIVQCQQLSSLGKTSIYKVIRDESNKVRTKSFCTSPTRLRCVRLVNRKDFLAFLERLPEDGDKSKRERP